MKQISLRMEDDLAERVDQARGMAPREAFIREIIRAYLANIAFVSRGGPEPAQQTTRSVIDTTLEPGQVSLAPSRRTRSAPPATPDACWHAWTKVDGKSVCKHCGQTYTKEKV